jgi:hypothetical protein
MDAMGLGEFCQQAATIDSARLVEQFTELERRRDEVTAVLAERNRAARDRLDGQFAALSKAISAVTSEGRPA